MSARTPIACFRDVLVYCDFTESKNQDIPYSMYLNNTDPTAIMIDFMRFGLKYCGLTSKNFLGDPNGLRELFIEVMAGGQKVKPVGWLQHLKIKHFGRHWRLIGKDIELIDISPFLARHELGRVFDVKKIGLELDGIDQVALMEGYQRNRALFGEHFAGVVACAFISMYHPVHAADVRQVRLLLEKKLKGG